MNRRAIGCGTVGAAAFILVGIIGVWRAGAPDECPQLLPYEPASYQPAGEATDEPTLTGVEAPLELAGSTSFGLASWPVWVEPGRAPADEDEPLPQRIVLDCGDGSFQAYQRAAE